MTNSNIIAQHACCMNASYHNHKGGGSFLILQDVMGWVTGFFIPCLGGGELMIFSHRGVPLCGLYIYIDPFWNF